MRYSLCLLLVLMFVAVWPSAAQSDPQTYTTPDGLQFEWPVGWHTAEAERGLDLASNPATLAASTPTDFGVLVHVRYNTADEFAAQYNAPIATDADLYALVTDINAVLFREEMLQLGSRTYRHAVRGATNDWRAFYVGTVGDFLVLVTAYGQNNEALRVQREVVETMIASIRMVGDEPPTTAPDTPTTTLEDRPYLWLQNYERAFGEETVSGFEDVAYADGVLLVYDGFGELIEIDAATGFILSYAHNDDVFSVDHLLAGPDGTLWAYSSSDGLMHLQRDMTLISSSGRELFGTGGIEAMTVGSDGLLYAVVTGSPAGIMVFDASGAPVRQLALPRTFDDAYGLHIAARPDGTLLLLDSSMDHVVIDPLGNEVDDDIRFRGGGNSFADQIAVDAAGNIYMFTVFDGLYYFDPEGRLLARFGDAQADSSAPLDHGELPSFGAQMTLVDGVGLAIVGSNSSYAHVMLIDMTTLE